MLDYQSTCPNVLCYDLGLMVDGCECSCCAVSSRAVLRHVAALCIQIQSPRFPSWKHAGLFQVTKPLVKYLWLQLSSHMRGAVLISIAELLFLYWILSTAQWRRVIHRIQLRENEAGVFQYCEHAPTILVSANPPIMAFIASKKYRRVSHKAG